MESQKRDSMGVYTITVPNIYVCEGDITEQSELPCRPPVTSTTHLHLKEPETSNRMGCSRPFTATICINTFIILFLAVLILLCEFGYIPHTKNGFYCGDPKISFPFQEDTASMGFLMSMVIIAPAIAIWMLEAIVYQPDDYSLKKTRFRVSGKFTLMWYYYYLLGAIINITVVEIGKSTLGEHRPHFFDSCSPDTAFNCTKGEYIRDFTCTNPKGFNRWMVVDASKSFPSGHTSLSIHLAIFMFWYIQQRMKHFGKAEPMMLTVLLQIVSLAFAIFCSLTRITDSRHHWWDVLVGFFIGVATAIYSIKTLAKNFEVGNTSLSRDSISNSDISSGRPAAHPSVRRLLSSPPSYVKEVSIE